MGLSKQAKTLNRSQVSMMSGYLRQGRNGLRNQTIFLLSVKSGLRAKEIAQLKWSEVCNSEGEVDISIRLTDESSKGRGGRVIPLHKEIRSNLIELLEDQKLLRGFEISNANIVRTERGSCTSSQTIVNMFQIWYKRLGLIGCSSHSGRRTFITQIAKKIHLVGGSLRDVQLMAGHSSLHITQKYIDWDQESQKKVVNLL